MLSKKTVFLFLMSIFVLVNVQLLAQKVFLIDLDQTEKEKTLLSSHMYCLDKTENYKNISDTSLLTNESHRISIFIKNELDSSLLRILSFGEPYLYVYDLNIKSSFESKISVPDPCNNFKLLFERGETKIISFNIKELNIKDPNQISAYLITPEYKAKKNQVIYKLQSAFLSIFAFLFLFNVILFFTTKWRIYIKYAVYIFFALIYFLYNYGIMQEVIPHVKTISSNLVHIWYSLIFISYFYFINDFGEYKTKVPKAYLLLNIGIIFKLTQTIFNSLFHISGSEFIYSELYIYTTIVLEIGLMSAIIYYIVKNKDFVGRIVILASLFIVIGGILDQIIVFKNYDHSYFIESAIVLELLTFSVALGVAMNQFYRDRNKSQQLYINELRINEKIKADFTNTLEVQIAERTLELKREKLEVEKKNTENEFLLGEIHHRVKNNLQLISSLFSLQERNINDPIAKEAISESKKRIESMVLIHKMLYQNEAFLSVDMKVFTHKLFDELLHSFGINKNNIFFEFNLSDFKIDVDTAIPLGLILNELITNSLKYAFPGNNNLQIKINLCIKENDLILEFWDNGKGAKDSLENGHSFGFKIIKSFTRQIGGELVISDINGLLINITIANYKT